MDSRTETQEDVESTSEVDRSRGPGRGLWTWGGPSVLPNLYVLPVTWWRYVGGPSRPTRTRIGVGGRRFLRGSCPGLVDTTRTQGLPDPTCNQSGNEVLGTRRGSTPTP